MSTFAAGAAGPVRIPVSALDLGGISARAVVRTAAMRGSGALSYGVTSRQMNEVGLLGEHAVHAYLSGLTDEVVLVGDSESGTRFGGGDITVGVYAESSSGSMRSGMDVGIEVKTNRFRDWKRLGRVLNAHQVDRLHAKVVVWCVVADALPTSAVIIMGWLSTDAIRSSALNEALSLAGQECVRVHEPMRAPGELVPWLGTLEVPPF